MNDAQVINLGGLLSRTVRLFPDHDAVIQGDQRWTWNKCVSDAADVVEAMDCPTLTSI